MDDNMKKYIEADMKKQIEELDKDLSDPAKWSINKRGSSAEIMKELQEEDK